MLRFLIRLLLWYPHTLQPDLTTKSLYISRAVSHFFLKLAQIKLKYATFEGNFLTSSWTKKLFVFLFKNIVASHNKNLHNILFCCFSVLFRMFFPSTVLMWDFLFINSPPVLSIFKKKFPPTIFFGAPVIFGNLEERWENHKFLL